MKTKHRFTLKEGYLSRHFEFYYFTIIILIVRLKTKNNDFLNSSSVFFSSPFLSFFLLLPFTNVHLSFRLKLSVSLLAEIIL